MKYLNGFFAFWYDFIVGDAWEVAVAVVAALTLAWVVVTVAPGLHEAIGPVVAMALMAALSASLWWEKQGRRFG